MQSKLFAAEYAFTYYYFYFKSSSDSCCKQNWS